MAISSRASYGVILSASALFLLSAAQTTHPASSEQPQSRIDVLERRASEADAKLSELQGKVAKLQGELALSRKEDVPVGGIVAWHRDNAKTPMRGQAKDAWVPCNGQVLQDGESKFDGMTIPDLNNTRMFLRGKEPPSNGDKWPEGQGTLVPQDWTTGMPKNPFTLAANEGEHGHSIKMGGPGGAGQDYPEYAGTSHAGEHTLSLGGGIHTHSVIGGDAETRPVNVAVVWMMRVK